MILLFYSNTVLNVDSVLFKGTLNNKATISDFPMRSVEVATSCPGHYTNTHPTHPASGFSTKAPRQFVMKSSTNGIDEQ